MKLTLDQPASDRATILISSSVDPDLWHCCLKMRSNCEFLIIRVLEVSGTVRHIDVPVTLEPDVEYQVEVKGLVKVVTRNEEGTNDTLRNSTHFWVACSESISFKGGSQTVLSNCKLELRVEQKTFRDAEVFFQISGTSQTPDLWEIRINEADTYTVSGSETSYRIPGWFDAGLTYSLGVRGMLEVRGGRTVRGEDVENAAYFIPWKSTIKFKAEFTPDDIRRLHGKAVAMATENGSPEVASKNCLWLYRNKPAEYFDAIFDGNGGIMEVRLKDNSGGQGSPINGRISGLFFMASVDRQSTEGRPIPMSPFGDTRVCIPAKDIVNLSTNIYFTDFYCLKQGGHHYVTLVVTRPGSTVDTFCSERLVKLTMTDHWENPFLFLDGSGHLRVCSKNGLLVEVFYTENLDIGAFKEKLKHNVTLLGSGVYTEGGIPQNPFCSQCNLYPRRSRH